MFIKIIIITTCQKIIKINLPKQFKKLIKDKDNLKTLTDKEKRDHLLNFLNSNYHQFMINLIKCCQI